MGNRISYFLWRREIPWTDDQIVEVLEIVKARRREKSKEKADAANMILEVKAGRLSRISLSVALPELVNTCEICGKKAIYYLGIKGRCSKHKLVSSRENDTHIRALHGKQISWGLLRENQSRVSLRSQAHHRARGRTSDFIK